MAEPGDTYARDWSGACGVLEATFIGLTQGGTAASLRLEDGKCVTVTRDELATDWQLVQDAKGKMVPPA